MSNNFVVRQIVKAGGSFFVGASIAIGTLCPIVLNSSRVLADDIYSLDIPTDAANEFKTLYNQGITPKTIAFTPDGGWVILYNNNEAAWNNIPQDAANVILALNKQGSTINTIAFAPNGGWVIIFDGNHYYPSGNFPQDALDGLNKTKSLYLTKSINTIAFTPDGEWVIIFNGNGYYPSANFSPDALNELATLNKQGSTIKSVAFSSNGGFVILYDSNGYYITNNVPQGVANAIVTEANAGYNLTNIAFTSDNGWALLYQESFLDYLNSSSIYQGQIDDINSVQF